LFSFLQIGILNGFLPCGLVYVALAAGVATGSVFKSGLLMFAFGLGTLPLMGTLMFSGQFIPLTLKSRLSAFTPYIIGMVACLLILRGLNLGIPYLSPTHEAGHLTCCHR
jgi:sulfite exporter TauE/SafE